jgi:hypothetical protein
MVRDHNFQLHKTKDKIIVLYVLIFRLLDRGWENETF